MNNLVVIVPVYNEEKNIKDLIVKILKYFKNIIVVDNSSIDNTVAMVNKLPVYLLRHRVNLGKSISMMTGINFAKKKGFSYAVFIDGDGQHKIEDLLKVAKEANRGLYDLIIGTRINLKHLNFKKRIGTKILEKIFYLLFGKNIKDIQSGLRAIKLDRINDLKWSSRGINHYFADAEITTLACRKNLKIQTVAITAIPSESYKGMNLAQGLLLIINLVCWKFNK